MLEDDQKFEELESKLAALSSQVEDLEQETEVDPFFEDDVRRVIDDFKSRELAGLESEDEDFDDDDSSSDDFISVQTTAGPSFKTHWIAPTSCENMTRDLARDAFVQGAADRYGTSQQVNNGDVLILLCREAVAEEPEEPEDGSEAEEPEPPKKICKYVGLAYNTLVHPASTEPPSETEELISAPVGNYEIFVWSSCECSDEPAETVEFLVSVDSSGDSDSTSYLKLGADDSSGYDSGVLDFLTDVEVAKANVVSNTLRGLTIDKAIETKTAGLYGGLTKLSTKLANWYVDYSKLKIKVKSDVGNLMSSAVQSGGSLSTKLLSAGECGNLTAVDPEEPEVLSILAAGSAADAQATVFNKNVEVSLGNVISVDVSELDDGPEGIPSTELSFSNLTTGEGEAATPVNIFLPTISNSDAGKIQTAVGPLPFLSNYDVSIEARYSVIYESESEGDAEYRIYKKEASNTGLTFASGLLTNPGTEGSSSKVLIGVIRVSEIPLAYSCDPVYGCMPDPAGSYTENTCGGNCTYRSFDPGEGVDSGEGYMWLWDAFYNYLGVDADFPDDATDEFKETYTQLTDLIHAGKRYQLIPANSGQYEYQWWGGSDGITHYQGGGGTGMAAGSLPIYNGTHTSHLRILSTQRPKGWPSNLRSRDLITGEIVEEEDFIEFNF